MELYISDHPLDCLTCSANGDCELQTQAGNVGLRDVRYGYDGANHLKAPIDASNPYFTFESSKCIVCSRCVRACEEVQGTFALTILGRGFDSKVSTGRRRFPVVRMRVLRRMRAGLPDRDPQRKAGHREGNAGAHGGDDLRLLRRRLLLQGGTQGRRSPAHGPLQGRQGQRGPFLRQGPVRLRLRHPQGPHPQADDPRADRGPVARSLLGRGASPMRRTNSGAFRRSTGATRSARSAPRAAPTRKCSWFRRWCAPDSATTISTPARVFATRRPALACPRPIGTSAGTQDFKSVEKSDVVVVIGANPTDAHPVFASRLKKRLRAGARLIVIDPRRIDLVKSAHIEADYHLALKPGTNVAVLNAMAHVVVTEGLVDEAFVRERCDLGQFRVLGAIRRRSPPFARGDGRGHRHRSAASCARPRVSMRPAATGRSITALASPSTARARRR